MEKERSPVQSFVTVLACVGSAKKKRLGCHILKFFLLLLLHTQLRFHSLSPTAGLRIFSQGWILIL